MTNDTRNPGTSTRQTVAICFLLPALAASSTGRATDAATDAYLAGYARALLEREFHASNDQFFTDSIEYPGLGLHFSF